MSLDLSRPPGLFSLSHVSIPFAPDDPIYGGRANDEAGGVITLGSVVIRGERNLLQIPDDYFLRLLCKPFYSYLSQPLTAFFNRKSMPITRTRNGSDIGRTVLALSQFLRLL